MLFPQLAPLEGTATFPRHRRGGCQPGATPRVSCTHTIVRPERAEDSAPLQGAQQLMDSATQGVALGWYATALSAPEGA